MRPRHTFDFGSETGEDSVASIAAAKNRLDDIEHRLKQHKDRVQDQENSEHTQSMESMQLNKEAALSLLELGQDSAAWNRARPLFDKFIHRQAWQDAIEICEILFRAEQTDSLVALGHGVWLAVTFPVSPQLTAALLQWVIDETPDDSDGAAVSAATAVYVTDLRKDLADDPDLYMHTQQMMATVARRHASVNDQTSYDQWVKKMELDDPGKFLVRLRNVIDVLVQDDWWFNRETIQAFIPS